MRIGLTKTVIMHTVATENIRLIFTAFDKTAVIVSAIRRDLYSIRPDTNGKYIISISYSVAENVD